MDIHDEIKIFYELIQTYEMTPEHLCVQSFELTQKFERTHIGVRNNVQ